MADDTNNPTDNSAPVAPAPAPAPKLYPSVSSPAEEDPYYGQGGTYVVNADGVKVRV